MLSALSAAFQSANSSVTGCVPLQNEEPLPPPPPGFQDSPSSPQRMTFIMTRGEYDAAVAAGADNATLARGGAALNVDVETPSPQPSAAGGGGAAGNGGAGSDAEQTSAKSIEFNTFVKEEHEKSIKPFMITKQVKRMDACGKYVMQKALFPCLIALRMSRIDEQTRILFILLKQIIQMEFKCRCCASRVVDYAKYCDAKGPILFQDVTPENDRSMRVNAAATASLKKYFIENSIIDAMACDKMFYDIFGYTSLEGTTCAISRIPSVEDVGEQQLMGIRTAASKIAKNIWKNVKQNMKNPDKRVLSWHIVTLTYPGFETSHDAKDPMNKVFQQKLTVGKNEQNGKSFRHYTYKYYWLNGMTPSQQAQFVKPTEEEEIEMAHGLIQYTDLIYFLLQRFTDIGMLKTSLEMVQDIVKGDAPHAEKVLPSVTWMMKIIDNILEKSVNPEVQNGLNNMTLSKIAYIIACAVASGNIVITVKKDVKMTEFLQFNGNTRDALESCNSVNGMRGLLTKRFSPENYMKKKAINDVDITQCINEFRLDKMVNRIMTIDDLENHGFTTYKVPEKDHEKTFTAESALAAMRISQREKKAKHRVDHASGFGARCGNTPHAAKLSRQNITKMSELFDMMKRGEVRSLEISATSAVPGVIGTSNMPDVLEEQGYPRNLFQKSYLYGTYTGIGSDKYFKTLKKSSGNYYIDVTHVIDMDDGGAYHNVLFVLDGARTAYLDESYPYNPCFKTALHNQYKDYGGVFEKLVLDTRLVVPSAEEGPIVYGINTTVTSQFTKTLSSTIGVRVNGKQHYLNSM